MAEQETKYFGTDGIRGRIGDSLITPEFVLKLGWAAGMVFGQGGKVLIGKDTRISGYMLESALEAGLSAAGVDIHFLGPMPPPAIAYLTRTFRANAGIVISASHNPYQDNGIKIFNPAGKKICQKLELQIESYMQKPLQTVDSSRLGRAVRLNDAPGRYIEFCKSTVATNMNFNGMKLVLDCANGATYHVASHVFSELGANVTAVGIAPDGFNINENCGSTHLQPLQAKVAAEKADFGIAFDGDGDRVMMVTADGEVIDGDQILYIIATDHLAMGTIDGGVVGTKMTNLGLEQSIRQLGLDFIRADVGDRHVLECLEQSGWLLGGETSGHIVHLGLTTTGDGIVSALQVLCAMQHTGMNLTELCAEMKQYPQQLINVKVKQPLKLANNKHIQQAVKTAEQQLQDRGRVLLRASGTEPVVRVMVEGEDDQLVTKLATELAEVVSSAG